MSDYDVIVLGSDPLGGHCAVAVAARGLRVAVVERELTGECSYWACIPSKSLPRPGEAVQSARQVPVARQGPSGDASDPAVAAVRRLDDRAGHAADPAPQRPGAGHPMTGKVAVITGASRGIGAGLVTGYRGQGWAVVATARTIKPSKDPDLLTVEGDLADPATAGQIVGGALQRFGRIDTLVNNTGVYLSKPFTGYTAADYATAAGAGLTGFFWLTQAAIAEMATRYGGHVVTVTATLAEAADSGTPAVLAALTKSGLAAATRSLAIEYAAYGIRVNAVALGIIDTAVHPADSYGHLGGRLPPLGRAGQVSDVVDGVLFLESSPYITGEILHIDGGQTAGHAGPYG